MMSRKKGLSKRKKGKNTFEDEETLNSLRYNAVHPTCVIAEEDITELAVVGKGFYATVKFGKWERPDNKTEKVAIKCIKEEVVRDHLAEILTEANTMVKLEHDNIIKLYGICLVTRENEQCKVKLVTEYALFGSLIAVIQDKDDEYRSFFCQITRLWEFANQIAKGMEYLHGKNLIHFDLAARNVLVVAHNKVRISDFGLARVLCHDQKKILLDKPIALAWCAPELFKNQLATKGCDVWSYGVLLWEMMSFGKQPWEGLSKQQIMEQAENRDKRLSQPLSSSDAIFEIMLDCWKQEPDNRPNFTKIIESLKKAKPVTASAKNNCWTARLNELRLQKGTKITLIKRYEVNKHLCQNDKAEVGFVNEEHINFKVTPVEVKLNKPKISTPFDMRHTSKEAILKEHNATGQFPVKVGNLVDLAGENPQENNPQPCFSQDQTAQTGDISGQAEYTPMNGASEDVDDNEPKTIKHDHSRRTSYPPLIPKRGDPLHQHSNTLPSKKRPPVPLPRKEKRKSTKNEGKDLKLEGINTIHSPCKDDEKGSELCSSVKPERKDSSLPPYEDDMEDATGYGDLKDHGPELEMIDETKPSVQTELHSEKKTDVKLSDRTYLIGFDQSIEDLQAVGKEEIERLKPLPLPKKDIKSQRVPNEPFPSLPNTPSPPVQKPLSKTNDPAIAIEMPINQSELEESLPIDLEIDENSDIQKKETTHEDDVPPPLPQKDILFRSRDLSFRSAQPTVECLQTPVQTPVQNTGGNHPIGFNTLRYPSTFADEDVPSSAGPVYSRPSVPASLPKLPERDPGLGDSTSTKPRLHSESSEKIETAYGDEINEGIATIQSEFPEISKDACYSRILEHKGDTDRILKVLQVSSLTGISENEAQYHLEHCGWKIERAVNWIFDKSQA